MLILASQSPRRQKLMKYITNDFEVKVSKVDETLPKKMSPSQAVMYLSQIKAEPFRNDEDIVIGADTVVALGSKILGKPKDEADARNMLKLLSGKKHSVYTGVTILGSQYSVTFFEQTKVKFYDLSDRDIDNYIATKEYTDKAGAYGIQGKGALLVEKIDGDFYNIVGLPIGTLNKELEKFLANK